MIVDGTCQNRNQACPGQYGNPRQPRENCLRPHAGCRVGVPARVHVITQHEGVPLWPTVICYAVNIPSGRFVCRRGWATTRWAAPAGGAHLLLEAMIGVRDFSFSDAWIRVGGMALMPAVGYTESVVEDAALQWFAKIGYDIGHGPDLERVALSKRERRYRMSSSIPAC